MGDWLWSWVSETPSLRVKCAALEVLITALKRKCTALGEGVKLSDQIAEVLRTHNADLSSKCRALERSVTSLNDLNIELQTQLRLAKGHIGRLTGNG